MRFLVILGWISAKITFDPVENAFAAQQLAFLDTTESDLRLKAFRFLEFFFRPSFFPFSLVFAAVIDLPLGLLAVKKLLRKRHQEG